MKNQIIKSSIFILTNIFICSIWKKVINLFRDNYNNILEGEPLPSLTEATLNSGLSVFIVLIVVCIMISAPQLRKVYDHCIFTLLIIESVILTFLCLSLVLPFFKIGHNM